MLVYSLLLGPGLVTGALFFLGQVNDTLLYSSRASRMSEHNAQLPQPFRMSDTPNLGTRLGAFYLDHGRWSYATFGKPSVLGPQGPASHLIKEAVELAKAPDDQMEQADCFLLLLDVVRRSGGNLLTLLEASERKLEINKMRQWGKPDADGVIEHARDDEPRPAGGTIDQYLS